ncbi:MAG TPA: oligosaccharide repeat unit polymerase family protein [Metalysinibacillus jejuensis]|uniref:Oligosaccharide repeat unit polymerase family protein n=1 Tax=Metalysinibacillus jejuensis TaxID=914327 RepID=A0A921NCV6_9BACL|nr:oligosaccharide repeat unit polymerase family protein [Metalysinibacillus jejuensis]
MSHLKSTLAKMNTIDTFSPYFFLPFILVLYFFTSLFDFHRFELFNISYSIWPAVITALVFYYIGVYIVDKKGWTFPTFGLAALGKYVVHFIVALMTIGIIAYALMIMQSGLGISDESVRRNLNPKLMFFSHLLWYGALLLLSYRMVKEKSMTWKKAIMYAAAFAVIMFLFLLMGYRTPLILMLFTGIIVFHYTVQRIKLSWFISFLLIVGILFSMFGFLRVVTEDTTKEFNNRDQPDISEMEEEEKEKLLTVEQQVNLTPKWVRGLNGESVTGHIVLSKIIEYTDKEGYLGGEIHAGVFSTVLPGEQISPRMKVTEVVNSLSVEDGKFITRPNRTTTPTFIGQLFLDGGYLLVAIGFLLYGAIVSLVYNKVKQGGTHTFHTVAYAFVITMFTVSMHTGLLDLIFVLMLGFVILASAIIKTPNPSRIQFGMRK